MRRKGNRRHRRRNNSDQRGEKGEKRSGLLSRRLSDERIRPELSLPGNRRPGKGHQGSYAGHGVGKTYGQTVVCGDVGFGKTEVAMRAARKAVVDGYQAGILAPTTILAQQHYESFLKRFEEVPVEIGLLSRFQTPRRIKETLKGLKDGTVDIVTGAHRMLSKDVAFKKLGLLVIDEEQRFGVRHKERIKQYRTTVDILTLSATPIPRTLNMSLIGIRDISVINTPPMDRRAVRTRLVKFSDYIIKEAVSREMRRRGQVYFIHNRVESIYYIGEYLNKLLPEARVGIAHGQMAEKNLERIMFDFTIFFNIS